MKNNSEQNTESAISWNYNRWNVDILKVMVFILFHELTEHNLND